MNLQQAKNAALLGVALSVTSGQLAAFEKLVEQQPVSAIEQDADYKKNKNLNGWGWEQKVKSSSKDDKAGAFSIVDNTDDGGGEDSNATQNTTPPKVSHVEINQFFNDQTLTEMNMIINANSTPNQRFNVFVNEDNNGWRTIATVNSTGEIDLEDISISDHAEFAVEPCVIDANGTMVCDDKISAGITYKVPTSQQQGPTDIIQAQIPTYSSTSRITGVSELLEKGFDMVSDGIKINAHCFTTPPGENHTFVTRTKVEQDFKFIKSRDLAIEMLDKKNTLKGSLAFGLINSQGNYYKNKLYQSAMKKRDKSLFMGFFKHINKTLVSRPNSELNLKNQYYQMLVDGNKTSFRSNCGDKYISSIDLGKEIYYYIRILDTKGYNLSQEDINTNFELKLKELINLGFTSDKKQTLLSEFGHFELEIRSVSAGANIAGVVTAHSSLESFLSSLEQFSDLNSSAANYTAVGLTTQDYPIPAPLAHKPLREVFLDYIPILDNIADWSLFNGQVEDRCEIYGEGYDYVTASGKKISSDVGKLYRDGLKRTQYDLCNTVRNTIQKEYSHCLAQSAWHSCVSGPSASNCKIGSKNCVDYAMDIHQWTPVKSIKTLNANKGSCGATSDCIETFWEETCLNSPEYILDYRVNHDSKPIGPYQRIAEGLSITEYDSWYVNWVKTDQFKLSGKQCARLTAELVSKALWKNTSRYRGDLSVHGFEFTHRVPYR